MTSVIINESELNMNMSTSNGLKKSFKEALVTPIRRTYAEWQKLYPKHLIVINEDDKVEFLPLKEEDDDFPDLIDEEGNVVALADDNVVSKPSVKSERIKRRGPKKPKRSKAKPREVKNFSFSPLELEQQAEYEKACRVKMTRVHIEEVSDDESDLDDDDNFVVSVTRRTKTADKNRRKRANRVAAKACAASAVACFERLLSKFIEEQAPRIQDPVIAQNIAAMKSIGMGKADIEFILRSCDCSSRTFSVKRLKRFKREAIQRKTARDAAEAFSRAFYSEKLRTMNRNAQRAEKLRAEIQSPVLGACITAVSASLVALSTIVRSVRRVEKKAHSFIDIIREQFLKLSNSLSKYGIALRCLVVYSIATYLYTLTENIALRIAISSAAHFCAPEVMRALLPTMDEIFQEAVGVQEQSGLEYGLFPKVISTLTLYFLGVHGQSNIVSAAVAAISKLPRFSKGVDTLVEYTFSAVEAVINVVNKLLKRPEFRFKNKYTKEIDTIIKTAWQLDKKITAKGFDARESPSVYSECMKSLSDIIRLIGIVHDDKDLRMELCQVRNIISSHCASLRTTLGHGAGFRVEPVSVVIESDPGVGKTMNIQAIVSTVLKASGVMPDLAYENVHQAMFTRPPNSDYFDGYYGQECYYLDDMFAVKPVPGKVSHFEDVMAFYGTVTTPLNMAECEKKGQFPFTSSLLLMTTNVKSLSEVGASAILVKPAAFKRRFDIHVHMEIKPEWALEGDNRKLDYVKYEAERAKLKAEGKFGINAHPWYMWEVWDTNFDAESTFVRGTGQCFSTVVNRIVSALKYKRMSHCRDMDHLKLLLSDKPLDEQNVANVEEQSGFSEIVAMEQQVVRGPMYSEDSVEADDLEDDWDICNYDSSTFKKFRASLRSPASLPECSLVEDFDVVECKPRTNKNFCFRRVSLDPIGISTKMSMLLRSLRSVDLMTLSIVVYATVSAFQAVKQKFFGKRADVESNGPLVKPTGYKQQFISSQSAGITVLHDKVYSQSYKMVVLMSQDESTALGQIIFVAGNIAVMPNHFLVQLSSAVANGTTCESTRVHLLPGVGCGAKIKTTVGAILSYPALRDDANDVAFVNFNKGLRKYSDISQHFLFDKEIRTLGGRKLTVHVAERFGEGDSEQCRKLCFFSEARVGKSPLPTSTRSYPNWIGYNATTIKGYCGAPVMITDGRYFSCRIVAGFHVAGAPMYDMGYATFCSQEMVKKAMSHFNYCDVKEATHEESFWPEEIHVQSKSEVDFTDDGTVGTAIPLYELSDGPSAPVRSKMVRTGFGDERYFDPEVELINEGQVTTELEVMKLGCHKGLDGETIYPMAQAVAPYFGDVFLPADKSFEKGLYAGLQPFSEATSNYSAVKLSFEEAVTGVNVLGLKSLTRATSVGFPLCMVAKDKKYFFGDGDDFNFDTPEANQLREEVLSLEKLVLEGKRPQFVCRDFLKDETRKKGKSARLIAGTDIRYYILCRMYFGAFVGAICRSHAQSGMCLGMNPYSEWGSLRSILLNPDPTGKNVWDGDFGQFDSSQMPKLLWECLDFINNWYSVRGCASGNGARYILFHDLVSSRHLLSYYGKATTVVEWAKSLPSGHFLTSTINSMLSMGLVASSYIGLTTRLDFWKTSAAISLGDDNVVSTSDELVPVFNQVTVSRYLRDTFDMVYTAGRKGEELRPTIGIDNVVFLQRRFAEKEGRVVCPIRPESFLQSLYYVRTLDHARNVETLDAGIELALEELSMHDEKFWPKVAPKLVAAKAMIGKVPNHSTLDSSAYFDLVQSRVPSYI